MIREAAERAGEEAYALAAQIYPLCRSITGPGLRETLRIIDQRAPLQLTEIPTGAAVLDWEIPREWSIREAWVKNASGRKVIDFAEHNLHVLNYSAPIHARMSLEALKPFLFTLPEEPDLIPYRTSYYAERWGFCLRHNDLLALEEGEYEVFIDSSLAPGALTYGEHMKVGAEADEVLISAHACHPSLANDNCSGLALAAIIAEAMRTRKTRFTYRFLFTPGTIGAIAWLATQGEAVARVKHGLVLSGVGDRGAPTYKKTEAGAALIDRAMAHVFRHDNSPQARILDFSPFGYDERQYNAPGFRIPIGRLQRSEFATYREYHTSGDDLSFITPEALAHSFALVMGAIDVIERNATYRNLAPWGEPQLGKRGLYGATGGDKDAYAANMAMLWVLNQSDGAHSLLDIAERSNTPFSRIADVAELMAEKGLLERVDERV